MHPARGAEEPETRFDGLAPWIEAHDSRHVGDHVDEGAGRDVVARFSRGIEAQRDRGEVKGREDRPDDHRGAASRTRPGRAHRGLGL